MEEVSYELTTSTLNQKYEQIINCRVVKPPHEIKWIFSNEFFLDKRLGISYLYESATKKFLDIKTISGRDYFLYKEGTKHYVWTFNGSSFINVTPDGFTVDSDSPTRMAIGRWVTWAKKTSWTVSTPQVVMADGTENFLDIPWYSWGYVKFWVWTASWVAAWDYVIFTSGPLKGTTNRIYQYDGNIYIIGTSIRGTTPDVWDTFDIYDNTGNTLMIGHTTWVNMVILDGYNVAETFSVMNSISPVFDIVNFDGNVFVLLQYRLFFSRSNLDWNWNFYALDNFTVDNWRSLFPTGKSLICFADTNKLFASATSTTNTIGYVGYDINYAADIYSKRSFIFSDNTIQVLQSDKQLMKIDIVQNNNTSFEIAASNMMITNRWLFEDLSGGEVLVFKHDRFHSYVWNNAWAARVFEFDKQFNHWIIHTFDCEVYGITNDYIITENWIGVRSGYLDGTTPYKQDVNLSYSPLTKISLISVIRTIFWLIDSKVDLTLDYESELGWQIRSESIALKKYPFDDTRLDTDSNIDDLLEEELPEKYTGNIVGIQNSIYKSWRHFRFSYNGYNRFCIGPTILFEDKFKPFVNELVGTK